MKLFCVLILTVFAAQNILAQKSAITIFIAGDSTAAQKLLEKRPETGWGEMLQKHFKDGKVIIDNRAQNGRSTRTFISENRWQQIVSDLKKGDYVFIEFGHNDESKEKVDRYTPPADFRANLVKFISETRAKKAIPVLLTPIMRRKFDKDGNLQDTHGEYPDIVRAVSAEHRVALIDMHRKSETVLKNLGAEKSRTLFLQLKAGENPNYPNGIEDNTHFNPAGAEAMANLAVEGIREQKINLRKYLRKQDK